MIHRSTSTSHVHGGRHRGGNKKGKPSFPRIAFRIPKGRRESREAGWLGPRLRGGDKTGWSPFLRARGSGFGLLGDVAR